MDSMYLVLAVAAGGAIGAVLRFAVYRTVDTEFPWATFIVNIVGCMLASFLMFRYGIDMDSTLRTFLFVGIFGAFTTMSTFSIDTVNLLCDQNYVGAGANVLINSVLCVAGAVAGRYVALLGRRLPDVRELELHHPRQVRDPDLQLIADPPCAEVDALLGLRGGVDRYGHRTLDA